MGKLGTGYSPIANWISQEKHLLSQGLGHDVGVPLTVDFLISKAHSLRVKYGPVNESPLEHNPHQLNGMELILLGDVRTDNIAPREVWINTYFFGSGLSEVRDSNGSNPLEGELKRYAARLYKKPIEQVVLTQYELCEYARANRLDHSFREAARKKLGI